MWPDMAGDKKCYSNGSQRHPNAIASGGGYRGRESRPLKIGHIGKKWGFLAIIQHFCIILNFQLRVWVCWGYPKPFFGKVLKSLKILEYFSYLDCFHTLSISRAVVHLKTTTSRPERSFEGVLFKSVLTCEAFFS